MDEVFAFEEWGVVVGGSLAEETLDRLEMLEDLWYPEFLDPFCKASLVCEEAVQADEYFVDVRVRRLDAKI